MEKERCSCRIYCEAILRKEKSFIFENMIFSSFVWVLGDLLDFGGVLCPS